MLQKIKNNLLYIIITILSFLPIVFWVNMKPLDMRFINWPVTFTSLGQITGLIGMAMYSLVLSLSIKSQIQKNIFGVNRVYISHHFFGGLSFILLLFHPLLLACNYLYISANSAALFLLPSSNWPINFGIFALGFMMVFLFITFFYKISSSVWKATHQYLGIVFLLAGLHSFFTPSDISRSFGLKIYMLILAIIGFAIFNYFTVFRLDKKLGPRPQRLNQDQVCDGGQGVTNA